MSTAGEVRNSELATGFDKTNKEGMLKELQFLKDTLEELYEKNVRLDEENSSLKKEVRDMKGQIGNVLQTMNVLREDLRKAHEILTKPRAKPKVEPVA